METKRVRKRDVNSKLVVGYVRVSSRRQVVEGLSLEQQAQTIGNYCQMRGLQLLEMVVERGVSGPKPLNTRPAGQRLIELLKDQRIVSVISIRLDRIFRDAVDCLITVRQWDKVGISLHLVDMGGQSIDTRGAMGRLFLGMLASFAELEHERISERVTETQAFKKNRGEKVGRFPQYGYRVGDNGRTLIPDGLEQAVIRHIAMLRAKGLSIAAIRDRLESEGYESRGDHWHATTIVRILKGNEDA